METKISKHFFEFGTLKYFRGNAHNLEIASYGEKKDPIGAKAHLDEQNKVKREHVKSRVEFNGTYSIKWNQVKKSDLEVNGNILYFGVKGGLAVKGTWETAKKANLHLKSIAIPEGKLKGMLNKDANGARNFMKNEGKDGRIVSEVWIVIDGTIAGRMNSKTKYDVDVSDLGNTVGLGITATFDNGEKYKIELAKGSTFAYKLHKVKDWNKGKTRIEDMEADYKGMG